MSTGPPDGLGEVAEAHHGSTMIKNDPLRSFTHKKSWVIPLDKKKENLEGVKSLRFLDFMILDVYGDGKRCS